MGNPPKYLRYWEVELSPAVFHQKDKIVEEAGYRTTKQMVRELLEAGERYSDFRRREYSYDLPEGDPTDDIPLSPLRSRNFDLADASRLSRELEEKFKLHQEDVKAKEAEKAAQEAALEQQEADKDVSVES
jgi:hypothetical protein